MNDSSYKIKKTSLVGILNNQQTEHILIVLQNAIFRINFIVFRTLLFLKSYILYLFHNNKELPIVDHNFIKLIISVISETNSRGRKIKVEKQNQREHLVLFYNEEFRYTTYGYTKIRRDYLGQILEYEIKNIITAIHTNIKEHYIQHLDRFIKTRFIYSMKGQLSNEQKIMLKKECITVKNDILNINSEEYSSESKYHDWIRQHKKNLIPEKNKFQNDSILYDVNSNPCDYIKCLIYMNIEMEKLGTKENPVRLFNVFPLRNGVIPCHINLDTSTLIQLFWKVGKRDKLKNIKKHQQLIWSQVFNMNNKVFRKKGYNFNFMVLTDGISISVLFKKLHKVRKYKEEYIEKQVNLGDRFRGKNYVTIDPGKSDLIYCMDNKNLDENGNYSEQGNHFRYTQNQRNKEIKNKDYLNKVDKIKKEEKINGLTIKQYEIVLSFYNSKSCKYLEFIKFAHSKDMMYVYLFIHYSKPIHRKFRWYRFINKQKSESKMINNFKKKFGDPTKTIVIMGDYSSGSYHMKGKEPTITKNIRILFKKNGYELYLINEFKTSKLCNKCHSEVKRFEKGKSGHLVWGLGILRCFISKF